MTQQVVVGGVDQTAFLRYGSMTVKLNTCDFTLVDPGFFFSLLGLPVTVKDPNWTGTVAHWQLTDIVDLQTNHHFTTISATNTASAAARPAPFSLSDIPSAAAPSHFLLEDGSGALVLEDGSAFAPGDYALENSADSYGYRSLSLESQTNIADQSVSTRLTATIFQPGLAPGMSVIVRSTNFGFAAGNTYVVSQVTTTWPDEVLPTFTVEMTGSLTEILPTLSRWRATG